MNLERIDIGLEILDAIEMEKGRYRVPKPGELSALRHLLADCKAAMKSATGLELASISDVAVEFRRRKMPFVMFNERPEGGLEMHVGCSFANAIGLCEMGKDLMVKSVNAEARPKPEEYEEDE